MYTSNNETDARYDVRNLCSRKLFELLAAESSLALSQQQLKSIEQELVARQHYLDELRKLRHSA